MFDVISLEELQHNKYYIGLSELTNLMLWDEKLNKFLGVAHIEEEYKLIDLPYISINTNENSFLPLMPVDINLNVIKNMNESGKLTLAS